jgi:hypothetical protein
MPDERRGPVRFRRLAALFTKFWDTEDRAMNALLHSTVLAVTVAAIAIVGIATVTGHEAAIANADSGVVAPRGDRLDIAARTDAEYVTVEKRVNGTSILTRVETAHE